MIRVFLKNLKYSTLKLEVARHLNRLHDILETCYMLITQL